MPERLTKEPLKKVSVVMCTYNGALFVEEQLHTILSQTYPLHEILVFDDASTDHTVDIIAKIAELKLIIKINRNEKNIGFNKNFEQALKAATGDIIAIADQDDIWLDTKIEEMMNAWKPDCPLIYCESKLFYDTVPTDLSLHPKWRRFEGTDARKIFLYNSISGHAMLLRKELLQFIFPFADGVMYDWWIGVVASYKGGVQYYPKVLVLQRGHDNNITINSKDKQVDKAEEERAYKKYLSRQLRKFSTTENMPVTHKQFALQFAGLLEKNEKGKFHFQLFMFLLRHSKLLFNYKKRKVGIFSYMKHSYLKSFG